MNKLTISIFENKVFLEILKENRLFREAQISFFENYDEESINKVNKNSVVVFFIDGSGYWFIILAKSLSDFFK